MAILIVLESLDKYLKTSNEKLFKKEILLKSLDKFLKTSNEKLLKKENKIIHHILNIFQFQKAKKFDKKIFE